MQDSQKGGELDPAVDIRRRYQKNYSQVRGQNKALIMAAKP